MLSRRNSSQGLVSYVGATTLASASTSSIAVSLPTGSKAGDLAVFNAFYPGAVRAYPTGFTTDDYVFGTYTLRTGYKVLTAADTTAGSVTLPANLSGFNWTILLAVYDGAISLTRRTQAEVSSSTTLAVPGFSQTDATLALLGISLADETASVPTFPSPFINRISGFDAFGAVTLADAQDPGAYFGGSITITGLSSGGGSRAAAVYELR